MSEKPFGKKDAPLRGEQNRRRTAVVSGKTEENMKKKIVAIIACVLIIATLGVMLSACNKTGYVDVSELLKDVNAEQSEVTAKSATKLQIASGSTVLESRSSGNLVVFAFEGAGIDLETQYTVYDIESNRICYQGYDRPYLFRLSNLLYPWENIFYTVKYDEVEMKETVSFYTSTSMIASNVEGEWVLASDKSILSSRFSSVNGLDIGNNNAIVKRGDEYAVSVSGNNDMALPITEIETAETENYRLYSYGSIDEMALLDATSLEIIRNFTIADIVGTASSSMRTDNVILLPEDKLLVQSIIRLPENTTKGYDYYTSTGYYNVKTYIYDLAKGKTKEVKNCEYLFEYGQYFKQAGVTVCSVLKIGEDKTIESDYVLQGFDADLNEALDIQSMLPRANDIDFVGGDYIILSSDTRVAYYKNGNEVFSAPKNKFTAIDTYLETSNIFVSSDGATIFNSDGTMITSLNALEANSFTLLYEAKNYIYFYKTEQDSVSGQDVTFLCSYDRNNGMINRVAPVGEFRIYSDLGCIVLASAENTGTYKLYDAETYSVLIDGLASNEINYTNVDGGYLVKTAMFDNETSMSEASYYYIKTY